MKRIIFMVGLLLVSTPSFAQSAQQDDDRALRGIVQSLSQAQQTLLALPEIITENKRLKSENQELQKKLDAVKSPETLK